MSQHYQDCFIHNQDDLVTAIAAMHFIFRLLSDIFAKLL